MTVSTLEPRKNFLGLIQAFAQLKAAPHGADLKLVIVGSPGWKYAPILAAMWGLVEQGSLIHLEQVRSEELRVLYTHADAFVFPSTAEGFGFPPLEAMSCDVPVIASDLPAHRWVLDSAALYCNPLDVASIAAAIERLVLSDEAPKLRRELIARGRKRVELFSRERCGRQWVDLLRELSEAADASGAASAVRRLSIDRAQAA